MTYKYKKKIKKSIKKIKRGGEGENNTQEETNQCTNIDKENVDVPLVNTFYDTSNLFKNNFLATLGHVSTKFFVGQTIKAKKNLYLFKNLLDCPKLKKNKFKLFINRLIDTNQQENFKCACRLIYLYFNKKLAFKYDFLMFRSKSLKDMCIYNYYITEQGKLNKSINNKKVIHFDEIFNTSAPYNFTNLYNDTNHKTMSTITFDEILEMRDKIKNCFIVTTRLNKKIDYSYLILYLLYDLHNNENFKEYLLPDEKIKEDAKLITPISNPCNENIECTSTTEDITSLNDLDKMLGFSMIPSSIKGLSSTIKKKMQSNPTSSNSTKSSLPKLSSITNGFKSLTSTLKSKLPSKQQTSNPVINPLQPQA